MKKSVLLLIGLLLTLTISAAKFYPVKITYKDGRIITGTATEPKNHIDPEIAFKEKKKKAKAVNISSNEIKTLEFTFEGGTLEYDRQKTYNDDKEKTMSEEMWLTVALRGRATLYYVDIKGTNMDEGGMVNSTTDRSWLCIRDGEEASTTILWDAMPHKTPRGMVMAMPSTRISAGTMMIMAPNPATPLNSPPAKQIPTILR